MVTPIQKGDRDATRILHIIHRMRPGGIQALVMNLYRHMDRSRFQFDFAVRSRVPEHFDEEILALGGRIFRLPWFHNNPLSPLSYRRELGRVLVEEGPFGGVHCHTEPYSGLVLPEAKKKGVPLRIVHSHNTSSQNQSLTWHIWTSLMRRKILSSATHFLACSEAAAEWLYGKAWASSRAEVFHNAIDLAPFAGLPDGRDEARKKLKLPPDGFLVAHVGRFDVQKNHGFLIGVFEALLAQRPDAHLLLVGEGVLRDRIGEDVQDKNIQHRVHFLGVRSDVPEILKAVDAFVFPSLFEGLGIVLIEAQAAGTPSIASDVVPREADVHLGLVRTETLSASKERWARQILAHAETGIPPWPERKAALQKAGYDLNLAAADLQAFYSRHASGPSRPG